MVWSRYIIETNKKYFW